MQIGTFEIGRGLGVRSQELPGILAEHNPQLAHFCGRQIFGLSGGQIAGLKYGGAACIQHVTLRRILCRKARIPWNYARFLDFAADRLLINADRLLIKKIGGGYIFFHRMLLKHFARITPN